MKGTNKLRTKPPVQTFAEPHGSSRKLNWVFKKLRESQGQGREGAWIIN